jgi:hypothetical protein
MDAVRRLLLACLLVAMGSGCSVDKASDAFEQESAETVDVAVDGPAPGWTCDQAVDEWQARIEQAGAAHADCVTAADCAVLEFFLECSVGYDVQLPSCPVVVSAAGEAAAMDELQAGMPAFCEQVPEGCLYAPKCACVGVGCPRSTLACVESRCVVAAVVPFSELTFVPTERPAGTWLADIAAFVPDWCTSEAEDASPTYHWPTLDCPGLATEWPCSAFLTPSPYAAAFTPGLPLLLRQVVEPLADAHPAECQCTGGIRTYEWSGLGFGTEGPHRTCVSLLALDNGVPVEIGSREALAQTFAPVETGAEALAFVAVEGLSATARGSAANLFTEADLRALAPPPGVTEPVCWDRQVQGTRIEAVEGGYRVTTFSPAFNCGTDFLDEVTLFVTNAGDVTFESSKPLCWYDEIPCVN